MTDLHKTPRLFTPEPLAQGAIVAASEAAHHYLKNVMRAEAGDTVRLFNGKDGEFAADIESIGKKTLNLAVRKKLRDQPAIARRLSLIFTPLKKERMDFLIEKAVELGAHDFYPVLTQHTDIRKIQEERVRAQIVEAAEQCERLDIPDLHPMQSLSAFLKNWGETPLLTGFERAGQTLPPPRVTSGDAAVLIGPPGGWTEDEMQAIAAHKAAIPVTLGETILRSETAALTMLALVR